ncbi:hypothetical protein K7472_23905 [Streptomyces sp. PTM05]|uniref:Uncharacterized protein n=1 Tax=Streptantibioticus parmotrematis TaxID=2873249 RepID=A0ABS7QXC4_9ACTN|nr:hypothetical protein [Streptantibioticus parmotrematis]MBY8887863.1 hypothetical protein [Streptantibioticus parmotrematis]
MSEIENGTQCRYFSKAWHRVPLAALQFIKTSSPCVTIHGAHLPGSPLM